MNVIAASRPGLHNSVIGYNRALHPQRPAGRPASITKWGVFGWAAGLVKTGRKDPGAWLVCNDWGFVAAVCPWSEGTLAPGEIKDDFEQLCLDMIGFEGAVSAHIYAESILRHGLYGGCSIVVMDTEQGFIIEHRDPEDIRYFRMDSRAYVIDENGVQSSPRYELVKETLKWSGDGDPAKDLKAFLKRPEMVEGTLHSSTVLSFDIYQKPTIWHDLGEGYEDVTFIMQGTDQQWNRAREIAANSTYDPHEVVRLINKTYNGTQGRDPILQWS